MRWYKHDPTAFLEGVIGLDAPERGFYITLINLIYARAPHGTVTDDLVCKAMACDPRMWRAIKKRLVAKQKVWMQADGTLMARRVEFVLSEARVRAEKRASFNDINNLSNANQNLTTRTVKKESSLSAVDKSPRHGATDKDGHVYLRKGNPEWDAYAEDYRAAHGREPRSNGQGGKWFHKLGEAHNAGRRAKADH